MRVSIPAPLLPQADRQDDLQEGHELCACELYHARGCLLEDAGYFPQQGLPAPFTAVPTKGSRQPGVILMIG